MQVESRPADTEHPRSVPRFFLTSASVYQGLPFPQEETLTNHQLVTGPFPTCWEEGGSSPQVDPSPTPHQQSPSEVANTSPLFWSVQVGNLKPTGFLLARQPGHVIQLGPEDSETSQECFCP